MTEETSQAAAPAARGKCNCGCDQCTGPVPFEHCGIQAFGCNK